jgi:DNA-binding CsgD family transcriptional regulator
LQRAEGLVTDPADRARCALALAEAYNYAGFHDAAAEVLERAYAVLAAGDPELRLEVEAALVAASLLVPDRIHDARRRLDAHPDLSGATPGERLFLMQQLSNAAGTNQPAPVIRALAERVVADTDTPETTDWAWGRLFLAAVGEFDDVRRLTDTGFAHAAERGSVIGFVTASFVRGLAEYWMGALVPAEAHFRAMLDQGATLNGGSLVPLLAGGNLAQTLAWQGRVDEALDLLAPFPEELAATDPANGVVTMSFARADTRSLAGDHVGALRAAEYAGRLVTALDVDSPTWAAWRAFAVGPLRSLGRLDEARALAAEHLVLCERSGVAHLVGEALRLTAEVADAPEEAIALFRRSVTVLGGSQSRLQETRSQIGLGAALRRAGRRSDAQQHLLTGRDLAQGCGARSLVDVAEAELAACGTRLRRLELSGLSALTASERRVAELAASGLRNTDIARQLFVTTKTVETHLSRTYRKLGVAGRNGLASLLSPDPTVSST